MHRTLATIIVKSVGKVAFFTSSFPSSPRPWFMRKIKGLKCFLLTFLKEGVFTQWILWSRYEMSRTSDAKFSYL